MDATHWTLALTTVDFGIVAGVSFDVALVKLPTRKRIGPVAYAHFARGNDLGNGKIVYPALGVLSIVLAVVLVVLVLGRDVPSAVTAWVIVGGACTILHSAVTGARAAPIMLSLADTPDDPVQLTAKLDAFSSWHVVRTLLQVGAFIALVAAMAAWW